MALGPQYCKQLREELRRHANFPPNRPVALGDYGVLRDQVFERLGNVRQFGVGFQSIEGSGESGFQFKSKGNVDFELVAKGDYLPDGVAAAKAGIELKFSSGNAVFFSAAGCTVQAVDDLRALETALIDLISQGRWESDFYVVTEVNRAARTTAIASSDKNCEVKLEAKSPDVESIDLGDASLDLQVKRSRNTSLEIVTAKDQVPLMQLSRLRGFLKDELRPEAPAAAGAGSLFRLTPDPDTISSFEPQSAESAADVVSEEAVTSEFQVALETQPSSFEVGRAINAYIPLLKACYEFSHGTDNPQLPPGYEIVAPIRVQMEETIAEAVEPVSPEAQAAVANDFQAMAQESARGGIEEGIASPDAFGFVFREVATGAIIVGIRGTQTPEEWVKNFTAVPNKFNEVPDFGLVHLGFEQMWRRIRPAVFSALGQIPASTRITFLGHSLGGAMATLGTVDVKRNLNRPSVDLCTFGSPRTGKIVFRMKFNKLIERCFRVTELRDVVPHVPSMITAWNHVGLQIEVRSQIANAHSLDSYLQGLQGIGAPMEVPAVGAPITEGLALGGMIAARTL